MKMTFQPKTAVDVVFSSIMKKGGFDEIFRVLKEKQRFSTGLQAWNIKSKSVSGDVRAA